MLHKKQIFEVLQNEENLLAQVLTILPFPEAKGLGGECWASREGFICLKWLSPVQ